MANSNGVKTGVYLIAIDGLPECYTWQDLKDFVRPEAEHEFWADLQSIQNGSGQKRGCIRTQRWKEASNLYKFLARASVNGRRLVIVLWDISQSPPKQMAPNPAQTMSGDQAKWASRVATGIASWPSVIPGPVGQPQTPAYGSQAALTRSMESMYLQQRQRLQQHQQAAYCVPQQQQQQKQVQAARQLPPSQGAYYASQQQPRRYDSPQSQAGASRFPPEYINSQTGTPINVRDGVALTVSRGVFVSGINYKAREEDIQRKFSSVGDVVKCMLQMDTSTGKSKGVATVLFSSTSEAQKAINKYNGATWMDKMIKVRIDKEATTLAAPPRSDASPLIVNGSRSQ